MFHSKKEVPVVTVFHVAIHRRSETVCFARDYPGPHNTAVCQPSRNAKQTQNNEQTTGDSKERVKKKGTPERGKKKVCERAK